MAAWHCGCFGESTPQAMGGPVERTMHRRERRRTRFGSHSPGRGQERRLTEASMEEREEAPCDADERALAAALSSGDLNTGEMDE
jgi:hypothetical protein